MSTVHPKVVMQCTQGNLTSTLQINEGTKAMSETSSNLMINSWESNQAMQTKMSRRRTNFG